MSEFVLVTGKERKREIQISGEKSFFFHSVVWDESWRGKIAQI